MGGLCPEGMYCPEGTGDPIGCPAGTFSNVKGLKNSSQCQLCSFGKYCGEKNMTSPSGTCIFFTYACKNSLFIKILYFCLMFLGNYYYEALIKRRNLF